MMKDMNSVKQNFILKRAIRTARMTRLIAKAIDLFIALIPSILFYPGGLILALIYVSVADGIQNGQSVGKKLMGLAVIELEKGKNCTMRHSLVRNLPFSIPLLFGIIPIWGILFFLLLGFPLITLELYLLFKLDSGRRLGDVIANTSVMGHDGANSKVESRHVSWFKENPYA